MAASALFILDLKGHVILYRDYRGDVPIRYAERFITKLNELEEAGKVNTHLCKLFVRLYCTACCKALHVFNLFYPCVACVESSEPALCMQVTPIISDEGVSYLYVQYSNLYLLIVTRENVNAASMLLFLHKLREVFVHYFNELEEESLRDNFVIAYELLDEVCKDAPFRACLR